MWWTQLVLVNVAPHQTAAVVALSDPAQVDALMALARRDRARGRERVTAWDLPFLTATGEPAVFPFGGEVGEPAPSELRVTPAADGVAALAYRWQTVDGEPRCWTGEAAAGVVAAHELAPGSVVLVVTRPVADRDAMWSLRSERFAQADFALRGRTRREREAALATLLGGG